MKKLLLTLMAMSLLAAPVVAQGVINPEKGPGSQNVVFGGTPIPDDGYDGTIASMACLTSPGAAGLVEDVTVDLTVNHTWVGDLTVKVVSPAGTITTLMSRPGEAEPADDGTICCGNDADLVETDPVNFADGNATSAEDMGAGGGIVCQGDGLCDYFPVPDTGPGTSLADFNGEDGAGDWQVCVGDSVGADAGEIVAASVNLTLAPNDPLVDIPTMGATGLTVMLIALMLAGMAIIRRK